MRPMPTLQNAFTRGHLAGQRRADRAARGTSPGPQPAQVFAEAAPSSGHRRPKIFSVFTPVSKRLVRNAALSPDDADTTVDLPTDPSKGQRRETLLERRSGNWVQIGCKSRLMFLDRS
jgi:hypothetical protein